MKPCAFSPGKNRGVPAARSATMAMEKCTKSDTPNHDRPFLLGKITMDKSICDTLW